ncbi:MAG: RnfABCDGE type electron transport complex subunit G [Candidatus Omnitrophica bacterium]|nr:RnfABCDGE type electron transport complex subunit G [Candidatus Omnitrophota bacterium]
MKEMIKFGFILGVICIVAAGLLAGVDILTKPKILAQEKLEEESSLKAIFPSAHHFTEVKENGEIIYYKAFDSDGKFMGIAFKASGKGYAGEVKTLAGMLKNGEIVAIKILSHNETPGLGSRITAANFTDRFKGRSDLSKVEAITGATISSRAVIDSVKKEAEEIKVKVKNEK